MNIFLFLKPKSEVEYLGAEMSVRQAMEKMEKTLIKKMVPEKMVKQEVKKVNQEKVKVKATEKIKVQVI